MKRYKHSIIANMFFLAILVFALANMVDTLDNLHRGITGNGLVIRSLFWGVICIFMTTSLLLGGLFSHGIIIHNEMIEFKFFYGSKTYKWEEIAFLSLKSNNELEVMEGLSGNFFKTKVVNGFKYNVLIKIIIIIGYKILFFYFIEDKICILTKEDFEKKDAGIVVGRMYGKHYEIIQIVLEKTKHNPGIEIDPGVYKLIDKRSD